MAHPPRCGRVRMPVAERVERVGDVERLWVSVAIAGRPWYWAIVHHVDGVLVDSGPSIARAAVMRFLRTRHTTHVLTTHLHEDHVGNHEALSADLRVVAPEATVRLLEDGPPRIPLYRRLTWGTHGPAPGARVVGDRVATPKRSFRVVPTPGHSMDHVAYLDETGSTVFTGDAYLGKPRTARLVEDVHTGLDSLRRLADLDVALLLPGHGPPVPRPRARLLDTVDHVEALARRCWKLHDAGTPPARIAREVMGRDPPLRWFSGGEFSTENLVENLLRRRV